MPEYESCERYQLGIGECCGATHEFQRGAKRRFIKKDLLIVHYPDGRELEVLKYSINFHEPQHALGFWMTWIDESERLVEIVESGEFNKLNDESRLAISLIHRTAIHCRMNPDCQFLKIEKKPIESE